MDPYKHFGPFLLAQVQNVDLYEHLEHQYVGVAIGVIAGGNDFFAGLEAFEDFVVLGVLAADADFALDGLCALLLTT